MHPEDHAATLRRAGADREGPPPADPARLALPADPADPAEAEGAADPLFEPGPPDRPASDSQLLRLGRLLGLRYGEAEALLESLAETAPPPLPALPPALRARLLPFSQELLDALQAVPGVFLLTDGVTPTRLLRARDRARAALAGAARLGRLRDWAEAAAGREVTLLDRAGTALCEALLGGVAGLGAAPRAGLGEAAVLLRELLRPLHTPRTPRRGAARAKDPRVRRRAPRLR